MFSKRLRFSILTLIYIIFTNNCYLGSAQAASSVIQQFTANGWISHNLDTYPPKVGSERYLYYAGTTSDLKGLKIAVKSIPTAAESETLTTATISFDYWGYGGSPTVDGDYRATDLFSLGASVRSEARPETVWANFTSSTLGNLQGDSWANFYSTFDTPVYPARIMITPTLSATEKAQNYYVALKSIEVVYYFQYPEVQTRTERDVDTNKEVLTNVTVIAERNVTLTCGPDGCTDFTLTEGVSFYWSDLHFPEKPTTFSTFYTPNGAKPADVEPYSLTVIRADSQDVCVGINYWLTEGSNLTLVLDTSTASMILTPTYVINVSDGSNDKYKWYKTNLCLSEYMFNPTIGNHTLSLIPSTVSAPDFIAIGEIVASRDITTPTLATPSAKMILDSWRKSSVTPANDWHYHPEDVVTANSDSLDLKSTSGGKGTIYIVSDWFNGSPELELHQRMVISTCSPQLVIKLQLIDGSNNLIDEQSSNLCESPAVTRSEKVYSITKGVVGSPHRLQFVIDWAQSFSPVTLTLSAVDLSDACRLDRAECSNHGTCTVSKPNEAKCVCDSGYMLETCSKPDYCVLEFTLSEASSTSKINGSDYCTARDGNCNSETFDPVLRAICECGSTKYWKFNQQLGHSCAPLDPCTGVNVFCPTGYTCAVDADDTASCSTCSEGYVANSTGHCNPEDPCDTSPCVGSNTACKAYELKAVCYCTNGVIYDTTKGCDTDTCSWDTYHALGCKQTCSVTNGNAECSCLPGYNLTDTSCVMDFNCSSNCSSYPGSVCAWDEATDESVCQCLPGYVSIEHKVNETSSLECLDICEAASLNETEAMKQVQSICGTSSCAMNGNKLTCTCDSPYVLGSDGRCHIETACDPIEGQGYITCSAMNAICQPNLQAVEYSGSLWTCMCPIGTFKDPTTGICVDQCTVGEKKCLFDNAVCQPSTTPGVTDHECVCQPGLKKNETDNRCYLIEHSLRVEMITRLDSNVVTLTNTQLQRKVTSFYLGAPAVDNLCSQYAPLDIPGCVDYLTRSALDKYEMQRPSLMRRAIREELIKILQQDLKNVYGSTFNDINVITYSKIDDTTASLGGDYRVILSMELTDPAMATYPLPLNDDAVCHPFDNKTSIKAADYCFIPTQSVFQRSSIVQGELTPCNETYISYCPSNTQCRALNYSQFACDCSPGFKAETIIQMDVQDRDSYYKEYCEDINECASSETNPCREHSTCVNTIGGYQCPCNHEYVEDVRTGTCITVCSTVQCIHGECQVVANNTGVCRCNEGYRGDSCEEQDPMVTTFRTALITVAVVLGLLLIGVVLVAVILIKKTKRSAMKQNAERPMAEYGRPKMPKRYQDNSGFTGD